jgi:Rrf2 family protein
MSRSEYPFQGSFVFMISQTAEYALRAIVFLANEGGQARTSSEIARVTHVPPGYLAKVMQSLSRARVVKSQRGLNGGFTLAHAPEELTVLAVINAVDPIHRYPECPLGISAHGRQLCPLHRRLDEAAEMVEKAFGETSIADLLSVPRDRRTTCKFPGLSAVKA